MTIEAYRDYREMTKRNHAGPSMSYTDMLIREMVEYGIDKAIVQGAGTFLMPNQKMAEEIKKYPDMLIGFCAFSATMSFPGGETVAEEIERALEMPEFEGVGDLTFASFRQETWPELHRGITLMMDVIAEKQVPVLLHTGTAPYGQSEMYKTLLWWQSPIWIDELAQEYPDVPIIIGHMGVQGYFYFGTYADIALMVAAKNYNVYLETSSAPVEVVERACADPAIGAEKVIFGTDWPAPFTTCKYKGKTYVSYKKKPPDEIPPHYKTYMHVLDEADITDEEREMILGRNMASLLGLN